MIEYYYDTFGRSTGYAINGVRQTTIDYDSFGRISTMTVPATENGENVHSPTPTQSSNSFHWTYLQGSDLKASLAYPNGLTASWTYDANNQLLQVRNATPTNVISQFDYTYDAAGRRTAIAKTGSAFGDLSGSVDTYTYNARSELTSARRTKNGQPIPGFSEDFDYDPIGNRRSSATYNEKGEAQTSTYQANNLNQYTSRTVPGYAAARGEADPDATVTVNENPTFRLGEYYFGSDTFDNSTSGGLANLETYAVLASPTNGPDEVSAVTSQVYLAQSPETFAYDDDGNQTLITTKTGRWQVQYNGENRPILWVRESDNMAIAMSYDHMGRRREKNAQRFFYDGYLQVCSYHSPTPTPNSSCYIWDPTEPVATRPLVWQTNNSDYFYAHDGNKNVSEVVDVDDGIVAHYEYASFGAAIVSQDELAESNTWRFSSEYADSELGLVYYNYRFYNPVNGRWIGRDPIVEEGFLRLIGSEKVALRSDVIALYVCCKNAVAIKHDYLGLVFPVMIIPPSTGMPCPDYCCGCNFTEVDALINSQKLVIEKIKKAIDHGNGHLINPFTVKEWANAAGGRSKKYEESSNCVKFATDRLENDLWRSLIDLVRWAKTSWAEMEKGRSETFIEYLEDVKKTCTSCSNQLGA